MSPLLFADRPLDRAEDHVRRYCGLPWSGGNPEVWAFPYYDALPGTDPDDVTPPDVLAAAALHPKLTRLDLVWFVDQRRALGDLLRSVPDADLAETDPSLLDALPRIAAGGIELSLLTKVLHRKRPGLIPLLDRSLLDWYRLRLTSRTAAAWPELVRELAVDLAVNRDSLEPLRLLVPLTDLRIVDIAIWMERSR